MIKDQERKEELNKTIILLYPFAFALVKFLILEILLKIRRTDVTRFKHDPLSKSIT